MTKPLIGITTSGRNTQGEFHSPGEYSDAVVRAGGAVALLPPVELEPEAWLDRCDGLILSGGGDVDPAAYNGPGHATVGGVDPARDRCEFALVKEAMRRRLPTLAICRGIQALNVALGGTLIADLPSAVGQKVFHRSRSGKAIPHGVRIEPDSTLAGVFGDHLCVPMSSHHQAVDRIAPGLRAVAWAADGVVEAAEAPEHPKLLAVQWHPEMSAPNDPLQQRLFVWLVDAATA
ncbi:MAG: gamma-glutamyl-gamma-aminobutyrate hydrolase family protein [Pirellulales bacterium]|nr:gamma-glutamyl-gamma-aminobutyrate hydrolase family protein [Pirellulales bacterium]